MEVKELRIGNMILWKGIEVKKVDAAIIARAESDPEGFNMNYNPITLTDEWLNKFGFQLDQYVEIESLIDEVGEWDVHLELEYGERGTVICISSDNLNESMNVPLNHVKYVHQFQNLFFALKGKELECN